MNKTTVVLSVALAMILLLTSGCGSPTPMVSETAGPTPMVSETAIPSPAVKDTLIIATTYDVTTFSRLGEMTGSDLRVFINMFDTLVINRNGETSPSLAESWTVSDDGLNYTFNLRKGVRFTNGEELKASDVVFTINQSMASEFTSYNFSSVADVIAVGDYTVQVTLSTPNATFLTGALSEMAVLSEKVWNDGGGTVEGYNQNPVGTGPYVLSEHNIGQNIVLVRNENYWGTKPAIKAVTFQVISDPNTAVVALQSGDIDVLYYAPPASIAELTNDPNLKVNEFIENELKSILVNCAATPFDDVRVRQALSYAIDKDSVIQIAGNGNGVQAGILATPNVFGYSDKVKGYDYDVAKAKELLAAAGYAEGLTIDMMTLPGVYATIAEVLQQQFSAVGITANIQTLDKNSYVEALITGNFQLGVFGIDMGTDMDFWSQIFEIGAGRDFVNYNGTEVSDLLKEARGTNDRNERLLLYEQVLQKLRDDAPLIPIYVAKGQIFTNKDLTLGYIDTMSIFSVAEVYWK
jgi:peptide/nickel transport system substrate-binding protein